MEEKVILEALNDYYAREEFDTIEKIPENGIISLGFTEYDFGDEDDEEHEVEVEYDLNRHKYTYYIDNYIVLTQDVGIDRFVEDLNCDFEDMIRDCVKIGFEMFGYEGYREEIESMAFDFNGEQYQIIGACHPATNEIYRVAFLMKYNEAFDDFDYVTHFDTSNLSEAFILKYAKDHLKG